jgi:site-specific recombinase XerD
VSGEAKSLVESSNRFLEASETRGLSPRTVRSYAHGLARLIDWLVTQKFRFKQMNEARLLQWVAVQRKQELTAQTINHRLTTCYLLYRFCFNREIPRSVGAVSSAPYYRGQGYDRLGLRFMRRRDRLQMKVKVPQVVMDILSPKEIGAFIQTCQRHRDLAIVLLMLLCGLRSCEVLALRREDILLAERQIRIHGKGNKQRMLPLPEMLIAVLDHYLHRERPNPGRTEQFFVILQGRKRGLPMTPAGLRSLFRSRRRSIHVPRANPHRFRHCFGTEMARAGVGLPVIQKLMGHADERMPQRYIHLSMADFADEYHAAMSKLNQRYGFGG